MSTDDPAFNAPPEPVQPDYLEPIARTGEQQFACILRNRSGFDAGNIDFGLRDFSSLSDAEQQDVCDTAFALYQACCDQVGKRAKNDVRASIAQGEG